MPIVELVYAPDCPNVGPTREVLQAALGEVGLPLQWLEHDVNDPSIPAHAQGRGSPTVLVDGRDILDAGGCGGAHCRLYRDDEGKLTGVPPVKAIVAAIRRGP
jgi:hypothetical protein